MKTIAAGAEPQQTARRRLAPEVRTRQILDAAQVEFLEHGFAEARIDNIARRCGLSKGGFYSHFVSKQALFEALLTRALSPPDLSDIPAFATQSQPQALATWLVDHFHAVLCQPQAITLLRFLIAESERASPHLLAWQRKVVRPYLEQLVTILPRRRDGKPSLLSRQPWLVVSPLVHVMVSQMLFGQQDGIVSVERYREAHIELLARLLDE